jgi:hypothetical protein
MRVLVAVKTQSGYKMKRTTIIAGAVAIAFALTSFGVSTRVAAQAPLKRVRVVAQAQLKFLPPEHDEQLAEQARNLLQQLRTEQGLGQSIKQTLRKMKEMGAVISKVRTERGLAVMIKWPKAAWSLPEQIGTGEVQLESDFCYSGWMLVDQQDYVDEGGHLWSNYTYRCSTGAIMICNTSGSEECDVVYDPFLN